MMLMHVSSFTELNGQTQTMMAMYTVPPVTDTTISTVDTPTLTDFYHSHNAIFKGV